MDAGQEQKGQVNSNDQSSTILCQAERQEERSSNRDLGESSEAAERRLSQAKAKDLTGPRTPRGKEKSRANALKHGIFSKVPLLRGESQSDIDALLRELRNDIQPKGMLEEILVEKLSSTIWRYRRLLMAEVAQSRTAAEGSSLDSFGQVFGKLRLSETGPDGQENKRLNAMVLGIPDGPQLDRFLRYEAALERHFDRTLSQLERLQRMRLGQPVLPKLEVQHSIS